MTANAIAFLMIASILLISFGQIRSQLLDTAAKHFDEVIRDAEIIRKTVELLHRTDVIGFRILARDKTWHSEWKELDNDLSVIIGQAKDEEEKRLLFSVNSALSRFAKVTKNCQQPAVRNRYKWRWNPAGNR